MLHVIAFSQKVFALAMVLVLSPTDLHVQDMTRCLRELSVQEDVYQDRLKDIL